MYMHCNGTLNTYSYHTLDSLVPPSSNECQNSPVSLEELCAYASVSYGHICPLLSNTPLPTLLHKVIWKAYLRDEYYEYIDLLHEYFSNKENVDQYEEPELCLYELPELLYHWPHELFTLKEVMPTFPSRFNPFSSICIWDAEIEECESGPYAMNGRYLHMFYQNVVNTIVQTFSSYYNESSIEQHKHFWRVRKIDVSGFYPLTLQDLEEIKECPFPLFDSIGMLEIFVDVDVDEPLDFEGNESDDGNGILPRFSDPSNSVVLKFVNVHGHMGGFIRLQGPYIGLCGTENIKQLIKPSVNSRAK